MLDVVAGHAQSRSRFVCLEELRTEVYLCGLQQASARMVGLTIALGDAAIADDHPMEKGGNACCKGM